MMRLLAAIGFLTRVPLPARWVFSAADVGHSTIAFPLVGAGLGAVSLAVLYLCRLNAPAQSGGLVGQPWLPPTLIAVLLVTLSAWMTGALHLDGLADMADGFGGGKTREDVLRIMRDHAVGAFGAVALILLMLTKVASLSSLIERGAADPYLLVAPVLGRWATVPLGRFVPYARRDGGGLGSAVTDHVGRRELLGATAIAGTLTVLVLGWRGVVCWLAVCVVTFVNARWCLRRIGGLTGDTLGANTEVSEAVVLVVATALTR